MKVVWLCHFSNEEIETYLKPWKKTQEKAPWIPATLKLLEGDDSFNIYVLAPYEYICGVRKFELRGIHYIFFNPYIPLWGRHWPNIFRWDYITNFVRNKRIIGRIIDDIKPEIIHLQGAENPYYSSTILPLISRYPIILTIQGFYSHSTEIKVGYRQKRIEIEQEILKKISFAFYRTKKMADDLISFNPNVCLFLNFYGSYFNVPVKKVDKKYDIVFFARVSKDKGIIDLLMAIALLKKKRCNIRLCVIGGGNIYEFKKLADDLYISENVEWVGFLPSRLDVYHMAQSAKVSVLPTYHDIIPGTIIESMFLGIPVVSYATDSIPEVNENEDVISLVEKGNIAALADEIERLLSDDLLRKERILKARKVAEDMFVHDGDEIKQSLLDGYSAAIAGFRNKSISS